MKKLIIIFFVLIYFPLVAQTEYNPQYFEAIEIIKSSKEYKFFCEKQNVKTDFEINHYNYSICEYEMFIKEKIKDCDSNWLVLDIPKNKNLQKKGVKGKSHSRLMFTQVQNSYFIGEVSTQKSNEYLLFIFLIDPESKVTLIQKENVFKEH